MFRLAFLLALSGLFLGVSADDVCPSDNSTLTDNVQCDDAVDAVKCPNGTCTANTAGTEFYCCPPATVTNSTTNSTSGNTTTTKTTPKATTPLNTCKDTITTCNNYLDLCKNAAYQSLLSQRCALSCKFCKAPVTGCTDAKAECATTWKTAGFCQSLSYTPATKKAYCAKTCALC